MAETVFILIGSNLGDREKSLAQALIKMETVDGLEIVATSGIYVSDAVQMEEGSPSFLNQVVMADYQYLPQELLDALESIEKSMGRTGKGKRVPRAIDLDILLYDEAFLSVYRNYSIRQDYQKKVLFEKARNT